MQRAPSYYKNQCTTPFFCMNSPRNRGWYQARVHPFSSGNGKGDREVMKTCCCPSPQLCLTHRSHARHQPIHECRCQQWRFEQNVLNNIGLEPRKVFQASTIRVQYSPSLSLCLPLALSLPFLSLSLDVLSDQWLNMIELFTFHVFHLREVVD